MKDAILSQTESVKVQVMNEKWDHAQAAAKQFMAAVKKSGFNLNSRLAEKDRQAAAAPKAKAKAQAAAKAAQTQATEAAAQINQEKVEKKPFFKLDSATFVVQAKMTAVTQHTAWQDGSVTSLSWPLLLKGCPFLQEWQAKPGVQLVQCSYAGTYAKDASKDPEGRTTRPLYSGQGHEEFAEFLGWVLKLFPSRPEVTGLPGPSRVAGSTATLRTSTWLARPPTACPNSSCWRTARCRGTCSIVTPSCLPCARPSTRARWAWRSA